MNDFFATIYELLYYNPDFSGNMYSYGLYTHMGLISLIFPLILALMFYKFIDHPRLNKKSHWIMVLTLNAILIFITTYFWTIFLFDSLNIDGNYMVETIEFSFVNACYSSLLLFLFSFVIKPFSINCSKTPF